jgi:hypothetical protein
MKKLLVVVMLFSISFVNAQVFTGKGDKKVQVGANFQEYARGVNGSFDYGIGENMSVGISSSYILGIKDGVKTDFEYKIDVKARFNANLGNVLNVSDKLDVYPGLHLGLKNFGGHLGGRYFFTDGFGVYSEFNMPLAKYGSEDDGFEKLHNQFSVNIGAVFNL